ncbi:MAG: prepilin peptidase [Pandoraea sp.]|nr:prepilin peptidase [Pandoraea sp.]
MDLTAAGAWPTWVAAGLLAGAAAINARTRTVPNWLTLGGVLSGWAVAGLGASGVVPLWGGLAPSVAATAVGYGMLTPLTSRGHLGAGCVKAQMAFGAWLGCAVETGPAVAAAVAAGLGGWLALAAVVGLVAAGRRSGLGWSRLPSQVPLSVGAIAGAAFALAGM